jgi:hypothetical protein
VLISGNAGDGKTAFLQRLEKEVEARGGSVNRGLANGSELSLDGKRYLINYDGSQDEGNKDNNQVLLDFLAPFKGNDAASWRPQETRLIAINEGRLVDFLAAHERDFPALTAALWPMTPAMLRAGRFWSARCEASFALRTGLLVSSVT